MSLLIWRTECLADPIMPQYLVSSIVLREPFKIAVAQHEQESLRKAPLNPNASKHALNFHDFQKGWPKDSNPRTGT
jgi:hypothetical protein